MSSSPALLGIPGLEHGTPLAPLTTFGIGGPAKHFCRAKTDDQLVSAVAAADVEGMPVYVLGGGSNVLVSDAGFGGLIVKIETSGLECLTEDRNDVVLRVGAGMELDELVQLTCQNGWWGIENLSLIPGTVGASPIQNVGAYGQEVGDVVETIEVWDRTKRRMAALRKEDCEFSYRRSVFNTSQRDRFVVLRVVLKLRKRGTPNLDHYAVREWLRNRRSFLERVGHAVGRRCGWPLLLRRLLNKRPSIHRMRHCVCSLRRDGRLPDPAKTGNAGCFFKSLLLRDGGESLLGLLSPAARDRLAARYRTANTPEGASCVKLSAVALIEALGLQDATHGGAELAASNRAIVVNATGSATARDVMLLAKTIRMAVFERAGLTIDMEPELVGFGEEELQFYLGLAGHGTAHRGRPPCSAHAPADCRGGSV